MKLEHYTSVIDVVFVDVREMCLKAFFLQVCKCACLSVSTLRLCPSKYIINSSVCVCQRQRESEKDCESCSNV